MARIYDLCGKQYITQNGTLYECSRCAGHAGYHEDDRGYGFRWFDYPPQLTVGGGQSMLIPRCPARNMHDEQCALVKGHAGPHKLEEELLDPRMSAVAAAPAKTPEPERLPAEVHNTKPVDTDIAMDAVRNLSRGS